MVVLGTGAAIPAHGRYLSSQFITLNDRYYLIDCGEGTQFQLSKYKLKISRVNEIFISHLHGDHFFGLFGLLSSLNLLGRTKNITIYSPPGLEAIINSCFIGSGLILRYTINFIEILPQDGYQLIFEDKMNKVYSFPLEHRIDTIGFRFEEQPKERNIIKEKLHPEIKLADIILLKKGVDVKDENGNVRFRASDFTKSAPDSRSFAYCSDTAYFPKLSDYVKGVDLLYHEATFHSSEQERAKTTCHSTALEAATIARDAEVGALLIGHFSSRYDTTKVLKEEAKSIFPLTFAAEEGMNIPIDKRIIKNLKD